MQINWSKFAQRFLWRCYQRDIISVRSGNLVRNLKRPTSCNVWNHPQVPSEHPSEDSLRWKAITFSISPPLSRILWKGDMLVLLPFAPGLFISSQNPRRWLRLVMCTARLRAVGRAKPGQSHSLTTALAWLEIMESQSRRPRLQLLDEVLSRRRVYHLMRLGQGDDAER